MSQLPGPPPASAVPPPTPEPEESARDSTASAEAAGTGDAGRRDPVDTLGPPIVPFPAAPVEPSPAAEHEARLGFRLVVVGGAVVLLVLMDMVRPFAGEFFGLRRFAGAIFGMGALLMAYGWYLQRPRRSAMPWPGGPRFQLVRLYTRAGCHLCEDAEAVLDRYRACWREFETVDVDTDPRWQAEHGQQIPVVEFDGRVQFRGQVSEFLLRRLIEGTKPLDDQTEPDRSGAPQ
jgi:glutaredoxin